MAVCSLAAVWAPLSAARLQGTGQSQAWVLTSQARESERLICSKIKQPYSPSTFTTTALTKRTEPRREKSAPLLTAAQRSLDDTTPPTPPKYLFIESEQIIETINWDSKQRFSPKSYKFAFLKHSRPSMNLATLELSPQGIPKHGKTRYRLNYIPSKTKQCLNLTLFINLTSVKQCLNVMPKLIPKLNLSKTRSKPNHIPKCNFIKTMLRPNLIQKPQKPLPSAERIG